MLFYGLYFLTWYLRRIIFFEIIRIWNLCLFLIIVIWLIIVVVVVIINYVSNLNNAKLIVCRDNFITKTKKFQLGGVHKLRLQDLSFFDRLPPSVYIFYSIKVYKKLIFPTTYPPPLVNVVCDQPLTVPAELGVLGGPLAPLFFAHDRSITLFFNQMTLIYRWLLIFLSFRRSWINMLKR